MNVVVDSNIIAYYWLPGTHTEHADEIRRKTEAWHVPRLWRSEFRSILAGLMRKDMLELAQARAVIRAAESELVEYESEIDSLDVLDLVAASTCSAYDCEFVALARTLGIPLVTEDRQILRDFPDTATRMSALIASDQ